MIKRVINSNLSLEDALQSVIEQSVSNILIQKGIENGDASPITDLGDVKKKGTSGIVVSVEGPSCKVKTGSGEIIEVNTQNGMVFNTLMEGANVSIDYDENGEAYLLNTVPSPMKSLHIANEFEILASAVGSKTGTINIAVEDGDIKSRILLQNDGIDIGMNSESLGGLIKIKELTDKLNDVLNAIKKLELAFNTHTHAVAGTATAVPNSPSTNMSITPAFNRNTYENKNVTHS